MKPNEIRPIAICVFREKDRILVAEGHDPVAQTFYRPLGGAIRCGEKGADTLIRELREELDVEIRDLRYLGALENIFTSACWRWERNDGSRESEGKAGARSGVLVAENCG